MKLGNANIRKCSIYCGWLILVQWNVDRYWRWNRPFLSRRTRVVGQAVVTGVTMVAMMLMESVSRSDKLLEVGFPFAPAMFALFAVQVLVLIPGSKRDFGRTTDQWLRIDSY